MNLDRLARICLLLLFALLQGVVPFAHAHVNGDHAGHDIHFAEIDPDHFFALGSHGHAALNKHHGLISGHDSGLGQLVVESEHSATVSMPPEVRRNDLTPDLHLNSGGGTQLALRLYHVLPLAISLPLTHPAAPYQHPCGQAPPA